MSSRPAAEVDPANDSAYWDHVTDTPGDENQCDCCLKSAPMTFLVQSPFPPSLLELADSLHPMRGTEELPDYLSVELCPTCNEACPEPYHSEDDDDDEGIIDGVKPRPLAAAVSDAASSTEATAAVNPVHAAENASPSPSPHLPDHQLDGGGDDNDTDDEQDKAADEEEDDERECRVCREGEGEAPLLSPCACKGSVRYVHAACLRSWVVSATSRGGGGLEEPAPHPLGALGELLAQQAGAPHALRCNVCQAPWALPGHPEARGRRRGVGVGGGEGVWRWLWRAGWRFAAEAAWPALRRGPAPPLRRFLRHALADQCAAHTSCVAFRMLFWAGVALVALAQAHAVLVLAAVVFAQFLRLDTAIDDAVLPAWLQAWLVQKFPPLSCFDQVTSSEHAAAPTAFALAVAMGANASRSLRSLPTLDLDHGLLALCLLAAELSAYGIPKRAWPRPVHDVAALFALLCPSLELALHLVISLPATAYFLRSGLGALGVLDPAAHPLSLGGGVSADNVGGAGDGGAADLPALGAQQGVQGIAFLASLFLGAVAALGFGLDAVLRFALALRGGEMGDHLAWFLRALGEAEARELAARRVEELWAATRRRAEEAEAEAEAEAGAEAAGAEVGKVSDF